MQQVKVRKDMKGGIMLAVVLVGRSRRPVI